MTNAEQVSNRWWLYSLIALLGLAGVVDAGYLTLEHLAGRSVQCTVTTGCSKVLSSNYATFFGIPTAAFGLMAYFSVFSLATLAAFGYRVAGRILVWLSLSMFGVSLFLVYLQAFVLHEYCIYCLLSAGLTTVITMLVLLNAGLRRR